MKGASIAGVAVLAAILAAPALAEIGGQGTNIPPPAPHLPSWFTWGIIICAFFYILASVSSVWRKSKRRVFDVTLALKYTDIFFKDIKDDRIAATRALIKFHKEHASWETFDDAPLVDPVLDVLDDIGFLLQGHQISDWVCYQYFSFWVQLYYEASRDYVAWWRKKDDSVYEHIEPLYDDMMVIMKHKCNKHLSELTYSPANLLKALEDEIKGED